MTLSVNGTGIALGAARVSLAISVPVAYSQAFNQIAEELGVSNGQLIRSAICQFINSQSELVRDLPDEVQTIRTITEATRPRLSARYRRRPVEDIA